MSLSYSMDCRKAHSDEILMQQEGEKCNVYITLGRSADLFPQHSLESVLTLRYTHTSLVSRPSQPYVKLLLFKLTHVRVKRGEGLVCPNT